MLAFLERLRIGTKLQVLMVGLTGVAIVVGCLGYWGLRQSCEALRQVGQHDLPNVQCLLTIRDVTNRIKAAQRTLLYPGLDVAVRKRQSERIDQAMSTMQDAWKTYESLPHRPEETAIWMQFVPAWRSLEERITQFREHSRELGLMIERCPAASDPKFSLGYTIREIANLHARANISFKTQVQEWKNILLRGNKAADFEKYLTAFVKEEKAVGTYLAQIEPLAVQTGMDPQLVTRLRQAHVELGVKYRDALKAFDKGNPQAGKLTDQAVRGLDRPFADGMEKLSAMIFQSENKLREIDVRNFNYQFEVCRPAMIRVEELLDSAIAAARRGATASIEQAEQSQATVIVVLAVVCLVGAFGGIGAGAVLTRSITRPLATIVAQLGEIADGDLRRDPAAAALRRGDEIGILARALAETIGGLRKIVDRMQDNARHLASASAELSATSVQLAGSAQETNSQSANVNAKAEQMSSNLRAMAEASDEVNSNSKRVAASVEEMTASVAEIARKAEASASVSESAARLADASQTRIDALASAASEIGKVVEVIQDIAEQTNLLALNATIEAARAGESGKGFAVVATEVKELARQSVTATEDIRGRITAIQAASGNVTQSLADIRQVIQEVRALSQGIASAVEEQSATTNEIAASLGQSTSATEQVAVGITQSSAASQAIAETISHVELAARQSALGAAETQAASVGLSEMAEQLQELVAHFRLTPPQMRRTESYSAKRNQIEGVRTPQ